MMHEDFINEINEDKKMGLDLSDTAYYNVDDGVNDEPLFDDPADAVTVTADEKKTVKKLGLAVSFLLGIIVCMAAVILCTQVFGVGHFVADKDYDYYIDLDKSYGKYYEIMKMIGEDPIAERDPEDISDEELKEIVGSIGDPYAEYYTAEEYAELEKKYAGEFVGVGIIVAADGDDLVIMQILDDTPAARSGLKPDDIILKVDGKTPADLTDAVSMITGEVGTKVKITIKRGDETIDFELNRQKIETDSVAYDVLEDYPEIGFISIASFIKGTDDEFKMAVKDLKAKGCTKFILDLRDNGGGLTDSSIEIADYLLPACKIMSENTKDGTETVYNSNASCEDLELVILVNENTASASEILTAALQDNKAGVVIGTKTYGKGVTQLMHRFSDGTAVKITVTEYFRPNGETVNGVGITPDIEAEGADVFEEALKELRQ